MVNTSSNSQFYVWDFGDNSPVSYAENPIHAYPSLQPGQYVVNLQVSDTNGCVDETSMLVISIEPLEMFVPNSITLNGDGLNDGFKPTFTLPELVKKYNLEIYNRWGQLIFATNNQYDAWYGTFNGDVVQLGTYSWKIQYSDYKGVNVNAYGHINVIR